MSTHKKKNFFKRPSGILCLAALLLVSIVIGLRLGSTKMSAKDFYAGLFLMDGAGTQSLILYQIRLPRILAGLLAGIGLSVSGVLLQSVTGNDMAAPNIIGVNAGAGFTVILFLCVAPAAVFALPFAAFAGAFLATLLIVSIAGKLGSGRATIILAGIAVTAMLNAGISFISMLDSDILASYNYFSIGGLAGVTYSALIVPACFIALTLFVAILFSGKINTLCLGDGVAASLGVRVRLLRTVCLVLASASAAAVVSFAGLLGFVGLVVPHMGRKLVGANSGFLLTVSAFAGSILVIVADMLGRVLFAPSEIPVGIIMALIGAPFFFILLIKRRRV